MIGTIGAIDWITPLTQLVSTGVGAGVSITQAKKQREHELAMIEQQARMLESQARAQAAMAQAQQAVAVSQPTGTMSSALIAVGGLVLLAMVGGLGAMALKRKKGRKS